MKSRLYFVTAIAAVLFTATGIAFAQTPGTQTKPQTPATSTGPVNIPIGKVALIFSAAFQDQKQGIAKFGVLVTKLNGEFQKTQDDLNQTAKTIQALQDEVKKLQETAGSDPKIVQSKVSQLDQMKKDYQRRGEDGQAAYQRRRQEIFTPLQEDVGKALDVYAKARGITLILDASQLEGILFASETIDITRAFIAEYNSKNPATTAAATTPK
jgi:Skp family chaperone for outer membrane proteins